MDLTSSLQIWLLGGFRIAVDGAPVEEGHWHLRKAAALVKLLALEPGHRLHRERVMEILWPDLTPSAAASNLRYALHVARRALGDGSGARRYLRLREDHVSLAAEMLPWVDADAFRAAAFEALATDDPARHESALALYTGDLLPEDPYEDWAARPREELRSIRLDVLRRLARLREAGGALDGAVSALERIIAVEPTDEMAQASLMRLQALRGDRARAIRQYDVLARTLRDELGLEPQSATRRLRDDILAGRVGPPAEERPLRHNLPAQLTTFVGRDEDIAEVTRLLASARLVTLTGPGGSGKSRLALAVCERAVDRLADGAWYVDLGSLTDGTVMWRAVAQTVGVPAGRLPDDLVARLRDRELILVLDNCEHLTADVGHVATTLLRECGRARVLVASA